MVQFVFWRLCVFRPMPSKRSQNIWNPCTGRIIGQAFKYYHSYIAMAGDEDSDSWKGWMMIHPAWSFAEGNAEEMRKQSRRTGKDVGEIFSVYVARGRWGHDPYVLWRGKDTDRTEAIDAGLATGILEPMKAVSQIQQGIKSPNKSEEMDKSKFDQLIEAVNSLVKKIKGLEGKRAIALPHDDWSTLVLRRRLWSQWTLGCIADKRQWTR